MKVRVFPRGYTLDLYGNSHILQGWYPSDLHEIYVFPRGYPLDLYGDTHIYEGVILGFA